MYCKWNPKSNPNSGKQNRALGPSPAHQCILLYRNHLFIRLNFLYLQMFTCMCGVLYKIKDRLLRHVRDRHPKKLLECWWCTYKVGFSLKYRMHQHEKTKHRQQCNAAEDRKNKERRTMENPTLVIPASPIRTPLAVVQNFQSSTPTGAMTPLRSPVPIALGIEHHEDLSSVKRDFKDLFGAGPRKVISLLPETMEKLSPASGNARTIIRNGIAPIWKCQRVRAFMTMPKGFWPHCTKPLQIENQEGR